MIIRINSMKQQKYIIEQSLTLTQKDYDKINEIWGKEMSMIEYIWKYMSYDMQVEVDKEMRLLINKEQ